MAGKLIGYWFDGIPPSVLHENEITEGRVSILIFKEDGVFDNKFFTKFRGKWEDHSASDSDDPKDYARWEIINGQLVIKSIAYTDRNEKGTIIAFNNVTFQDRNNVVVLHTTKLIEDGITIFENGKHYEEDGTLSDHQPREEDITLRRISKEEYEKFVAIAKK